MVINTLFEERLINIGSKTYKVELCIYNNKKYIRTYEEHEFEKVFDFGFFTGQYI